MHFLKALCQISFSAVNALNASACNCLSVWWLGNVLALNSSNATHLPPLPPPLSSSCWQDGCEHPFLVSQSRICPGIPVNLSVAIAYLSIFFSNAEVCIVFEAYDSPAEAFSVPLSNTIALSFVPPLNFGVTNAYAIVTNSLNQVVGQILSDALTFNVTFPDSSEIPSPIFTFNLFIGENTHIPIDRKYTVYDLGVFRGDSFTPVGLTSYEFFSDNLTFVVEFYNVSMELTNEMYVLIIRMEDYDGNVLLSGSQYGILLTTAILYTVGAVVVFAIQLINWMVLVEVSSTAWLTSLQALLLMGFRAVYFYLISEYIIVVGSLLDYVLIEIPTFFYLGIFLLFLVHLASFVRYAKYQKKTSESTSWGLVGLTILAVWLTFAAIIIALSYETVSGQIVTTCECRESTLIEPSDVSRYIRIGYKSAILFLSLVVVVSLWTLTRNTLFHQRRQMFYQLMWISICLCLNCISFVIYYAVGTPTPYFAIDLWLTEYLPILSLTITFGVPGLKLVYLKATT